MRSDDLLDDALASYSAREPDARLERRVMAVVRCVRARRGAAWFGGFLCAAALVWVMMIPVPVKPVPHKSPVAVQPVRLIRETPPVHRVRIRRVREAQPFPALPPLTEGERAMIAFAQSAPEDVVRSVIDRHENASEPIEIQELVVQPLPQ